MSETSIIQVHIRLFFIDPPLDKIMPRKSHLVQRRIVFSNLNRKAMLEDKVWDRSAPKMMCAFFRLA